MEENFRIFNVFTVLRDFFPDFKVRYSHCAVINDAKPRQESHMNAKSNDFFLGIC